MATTTTTTRLLASAAKCRAGPCSSSGAGSPLYSSPKLLDDFHEENDDTKTLFASNEIRGSIPLRSRGTARAMAMAMPARLGSLPCRGWSSWRWRRRQRCRAGPRCYCSTSAEVLQVLDSAQAGLVDRYIDSLLRWNERMNLTSVTDREQVMIRHVADSLALLPVIDDALTRHCTFDAEASLNVVDVGSGAGLPGIIIGIARPDWQVTLMESIQKKCDFLNDAVRSVDLQNVKVIRARAEDKGQEKRHREAYHIAVARAVAEMRVLAELCLPLVCVGGIMVAAKGASPQEEVDKAKKAVNVLGGLLLPICRVTSESPLGMRTAAVCLKRSPTPAKYPRKPGVPSKQPL